MNSQAVGHNHQQQWLELGGRHGLRACVCRCPCCDERLCVEAGDPQASNVHDDVSQRGHYAHQKGKFCLRVVLALVLVVVAVVELSSLSVCL